MSLLLLCSLFTKLSVVCPALCRALGLVPQELSPLQAVLIVNREGNMLALPVTSWGCLGQVLHSLGPQFPPLENGAVVALLSWDCRENEMNARSIILVITCLAFIHSPALFLQLTECVPTSCLCPGSSSPVFGMPSPGSSFADFFPTHCVLSEASLPMLLMELSAHHWLLSIPAASKAGPGGKSS